MTTSDRLGNKILERLPELDFRRIVGMGRFEPEYMGRGPKEVRAHLLGDLIVVRLTGVLTTAEQHLVKTLPGDKGRYLLKRCGETLGQTPGLEVDDRDGSYASCVRFY